MYQLLATKMAVSTTVDQVSQAVSMAAANSATIDLTVYSGTIDGVTLEGSNDLENWVTLTELLTTGTLTAGAYYLPGTSSAFSAPEKDIGTQYVRVRFGASAAAIVAAGINTASL